MKKFIITMAGIACLTLAASTAWAQEDELKAFPGYVDFGQLSDIFGEPNVEIAVGKGLLSFVSAFTTNEDPEVANLFSRLDGVRVRVFETDQLADGAIDLVRNVSSSLSGSGWESVVSVNSTDEQVRIFMKLNDDLIEGITVMAVEPDEAVFINVIGFLDPAELARLMDHFEVDVNDIQINGVEINGDD
ncbi:MAG TPA: DUF4252 domain-containing protein [Xanthomonadales bacterium]|nr:DUF4252 domain-containing protein [Xanthomonadales bacterium]